MDVDVIIQGDALKEMRKLPDESIDCCVTSPPYYGLRDYGCDGQIGLEESPEAYVSKLVEVFREVRRVLKDEGTLWLNLGDSYAGSWGNSGHRPEIDGTPSHQRDKKTKYFARGGWDQRREVPPNQKVAGCKPKDLIGIPWMVAFALRTDGWYLRSDIIWHKPNCVPESCKDRPTKGHEYMFLLSKGKKYYYDHIAIQDKAQNDFGKTWEKRKLAGHPMRYGHDAESQSKIPLGTSEGGMCNKRTVWTIPTKPFKEAHFATFPEKLVEPCVLAGTSEKGYCPACGKPWIRKLERIATNPKSREDRQKVTGGAISGGVGNNFPDVQTRTIDWISSCECSSDPVPGVVLDPFFGAGTVGVVAKKLGRSYIGIELNPDYVEIARRRIAAIPARLDRWYTP